MYYDRKTYEEHRDVWLWLASRIASMFTFRKKKLATIDHVAVQVDDIAEMMIWLDSQYEGFYYLGF